MGQTIGASEFSAADFAEFSRRLAAETALLRRWFDEQRFCTGPRTGGFELEAWLVDRQMAPAPLIDELLVRVDDPLVVPELARFNLELNGTPQPLTGRALSHLHAELVRTLAHCEAAAVPLGARILRIGILPTIRPEHLVLAQMTPRDRYRALNEQILRLRGGTPIQLEIRGQQSIAIEQPDVMLEAAATSFQIHIRMQSGESALMFNLGKILAAPMVALGANAAYLFGRELWAETRVPLFEQAVAVGGPRLRQRVGFGIRYAKRSVLEVFESNLSRYEVLLPHLHDTPPEALAHLRLHNGTIWRWNRPLIGFDGPDWERPHLRLEHRVVASGPSAADDVANAAFLFGCLHALAAEHSPLPALIPFVQARANFYRAARFGLSAAVRWTDGTRIPLWRLILEDLLPRADAGLAALGIDADERDRWLGIVRERARTQRTGSAWARAWVARHGNQMEALTAAYLAQQTTGRPVHEWPLD
ncbi:glutamate--cysteine ligase [Thioalkalicoccus limnaeus]|uniref:Glutamate--cysteine ligase n=1 Tax=Thioalkalicoccus limnaeus TaxID=120681 RepID=A0ABV4BIC2_9GAMM